MIPDSQYYFGSISSIYYDTPTLELYYEKRNSDYLKTKVRLRWYSDESKGTLDNELQCYLELKSKNGVFRQKRRMPLSLSLTALKGDPFSEEEIVLVPSRVHELSYVSSGPLVPTVLIQYKRYRFVEVESHSRVALDVNIRCTHANPAYIMGFPPVHLSEGVLEIKGVHRYLPSSLNSISSYLSREAFSKYARCLEHPMLPLSRRI